MAKLGMGGMKGLHFKVGGGMRGRSMRASSGGMGGMPRRVTNPFKQARMMVMRSTGPARLRGRPY